ncbi:MAG: DUF4271 domain-containing protein [Bacteroidota bacterium]
MRFFVFTLIFWVFSGSLHAQLNAGNSRSDSLVAPVIADAGKVSLDSCRLLVIKKSFLPVGKEGQKLIRKDKIKSKLQWHFYYLFLVFFFFAVIKLLYPRYLNDLFRVFFRTSLKANQIKEQLVASVWQSMLFNLLFFLSAGFYLYLLMARYQFPFYKSEVVLLLVCTGLFLSIYLGKYLFLRLAGWLFNVNQAADTYVFIVFLVNKMAGIILLPFLIVIAFAPAIIAEAAIIISFIVLTVLIFYRSLLGYQTGTGISKLSNFHFFIYVMAMEISPLMILTRLLLNIF